MTTFNEVLNKMYDYDYLIGFKDGKGTVLKWNGPGNWAPKQDMDVPFAINQLIKVLLAKTGIKLFDEAINEELIKTIYDVLERHNIAEDENNGKKEKKG